MKGILADANIEGQVERLVQRLLEEPWREFWDDLGIQPFRFPAVGLPLDATDADVWQLCQAKQLVLITSNRNARGSTSLEETIRQNNTASRLPVFTLSDSKRILRSSEYADRVVEKMLDFLQRIESLRGTGRLFLP